jgi:tetratricopeptide (TPR) repeat protein
MVIALASQGWIVYKKEKLNRTLYNFLDKFESNHCELESQDMPFEERMVKPLLLLAQAFEKSGDYAKSINITLYLIRHTKDDELLIYLGKIYLKAGFLERAEEIFVQLIKRHPRRVDVLFQLELIYESLNRLDEANEVIDAIEANGKDVKILREYLEFLRIKSNSLLTKQERVSKLKMVLERDRLFRLVIRELFLIEPDTAWSYISDEKVEIVVDILWYLPYSKLQLDIILRSNILKSIYFARGVIDEAPSKRCGIFAFDMLVSAKTAGYEKGDVNFLYICQECKSSFPISFDRCPECMEINSIKVEESVGKKEPQKGNSLL